MTRLEEIIKQMREAAKLQDPQAKLTIEMLRLYADELKERLVSAEGEDMLRSQGAVRSLNRLHRDLTTMPPIKPTT